MTKPIGETFPDGVVVSPQFFLEETMIGRARRVAIETARDTLIDLTTRHPGKVADRLLEHPDFFRGMSLDMAKTITVSLLENGQRDALLRLLGMKAIGWRRSAMLAELLLIDSFSQDDGL